MNDLRIILWTSLAFALLTPTAAHALSLFPDPLGVNALGVDGEVTLLSVETGAPTGGIVSLGIASPTDTTLVLGGSLDPGSAPGNGLFLSVRDAGGTVIPFTAAGWIPGAGTDITIVGASGGVVSFVPTVLSGGTVIDAVFLSFASPVPEDGSLFLHASFVSSASSDGVGVLVPEPATASLLALGLVGIAAMRRQRAN
jgi:hypothetical protein